MKNVVLSMKNIDKRFTGVHALKSVNFELCESEIHALVGENGAGKSTLMKALTGIFPKDSGEILYMGKLFNPQGPKEALDAGIAIVHQELSMMEHLTVAQNLFIGRESTKRGGWFLDEKAQNKRALDLFKQLNMEINPQEKMANLTVGKQQMLLSRGKGFRDTIIDLIVTNTSLTKNDIAVIGSTAYIASDSPTRGNKLFIEMIVPASTAMTDATNSAQSVLNRVVSDNILGIFCSNEATVKGLLAATDDGATLKSNPNLRNVVVVGYDAGEGQKRAVRNQYFLGSITQDPYMIGYRAVELAYKAYKGEPVADVDTGAKFWDYTNMDDEDIRGLLYD